jgi:hypothetical protein
MLWVRPRSRPVAAVCATTPGVAVASIALAPTVWIAVLSTTVAGLNSGPLARRMCGAGASAW